MELGDKLLHQCIFFRNRKMKAGKGGGRGGEGNVRVVFRCVVCSLPRERDARFLCSLKPRFDCYKARSCSMPRLNPHRLESPIE